MRILLLCNRPPWPLKDGGAIAMYRMAEGFHKLGCELHLLFFNTKKHWVAPEDFPPLFRELKECRPVYLDAGVKAVQAAGNLLFSRKSYHIWRFWSEDFNKVLSEFLQRYQYNVVQLELPHMGLYLHTIRHYHKNIISLRAHNVEHLIWQRLAAAETHGAKKLYLHIQAARLARFEKEILNRFDALIPITAHDGEVLKSLGANVPQYVAPTGVDLSQYNYEPSLAEPETVFHLGALNWLPNQQGIRWFLDHVWPKVWAAVPTAKFTLAGRYMPDWAFQLDLPGVSVAGEIPDAVDFMNRQSIMVVPLMSGSGMRIKILEGMAVGKAIVSTSIGAEGIAVKNGEHLLLADDAESFAERVVRLIKDESLRHKLGSNARALVAEYYDNKSIMKGLVDFYSWIQA